MEPNKQLILYNQAAHVDRRHHLVSRAFKKAFLLTGPVIQEAPEDLFKPLWRRNQVRGFAPFKMECYVLSMSDLKAIHKQVRAAHDDLRDLEISSLIRALKKLSILLYTGQDERLWKSTDGRIFLKPDQLAQEGRLGKIPLKSALETFALNVWKRQEPGMYAMLIEEHHCSPEDIQCLVDIIESNRGRRGKEVHKLASARIDQIISDKFRSRRPASQPPVAPEFFEDPELRRHGEIATLIRQLDNIYKMQQLSTADVMKAEDIKKRLREQYGLSREELDTRLADVRWKRMFPNSKKK